MADDDLPALAPAELEVMKALWDEGPLAAREVHERIASGLGWSVSTTRTVIERLVRKGAVTKCDAHGLHVYEATISRAGGFARLVRDFTRQVLELQRAPVASLFAASDALTEDELAELQALLDRETTRGPQR